MATSFGKFVMTLRSSRCPQTFKDIHALFFALISVVCAQQLLTDVIAPSLNSAWNSGPVVHEGPDSFGVQPISTSTQGNWDQGAEAPGWPIQYTSSATQANEEQHVKAPDFGFANKAVKNRAQTIEARGPSQDKDTSHEGNHQGAARDVKTAKICGNCGEVG